MTQKPENRKRVNVREFGFSPMSLRLWHGMAFDAWLRAMRGKWHLVSPRRYPLIVTITLFSLFNQVMKWLSSLIYGHRLSKVTISPDPIFVIGHWRSGTTWLHHLLMSDPRFAAPNVSACFRPETFLVGRAVFTPIMGMLLAEKRPMDNVKLKPENAEEDENAICLSGAISPYRNNMFPNNQTEFAYDPADMSEEDAAFWRRKWLAFLRRVQFVNPGKRLVLKSPTHSLRIKEILRQFPDARFIHIVRDPYKVFLSSQKSRRAMPSVNGLQDHLPPQEQQDQRTVTRFMDVHRTVVAEKEHIPENQIFTLRYEDLKSDTLSVLQQVYDHLDLGDFSNIKPSLEKLAATQKPYQNNQYDLDANTRTLVEDNFTEYFECYGYLPMAQRATAIE